MQGFARVRVRSSRGEGEGFAATLFVNIDSDFAMTFLLPTMPALCLMQGVVPEGFHAPLKLCYGRERGGRPSTMGEGGGIAPGPVFVPSADISAQYEVRQRCRDQIVLMWEGKGWMDA